MELPSRPRGDELLRPGELVDIRRRLRKIAGGHDLVTVIAYAFDHRTRMLPFVYADMRMVPSGVRAIGSAMVDSGFDKTRIVLQQWNRNFRPSQMRLDGRIPDLFMVSTMQLHGEKCRELIRDAWRIDPAHRPLIIIGGPKMFYEPWDVFGTEPADPWGADVAVTGEEYILLNLLEVLLSERANNEPLRETFQRVRDGGILDEIPGLVYAQGDVDGVAQELVDTGIQRLAGDLDELPHPVPGYRLLEPPGRKATLGPAAIPAGRIHRYSPLGGLVLTLGCKFNCSYCPIPAYNQRQYRAKSGRRILEEMSRLYSEYGQRFFFGADDNFFNDKERTLDIVETLARAEIGGVSFRHNIRWGTEVTVHDTLQMKDHLRIVRRAGVRSLWLGVEDMTGTLVRKGQSVDKTNEVFRLLRARGILPMPMMMHHDDQPLITRGSDYGLLNQVNLLKKAGAGSLQVLMISPAPGSKMYIETYDSRLVIASAGGRKVQPHMHDANYVIASRHKRPWKKQLNIIAAYALYYNPLCLLMLLGRPKNRQIASDIIMQLIGIFGLMKTIRRTLGWALRLMWGRIEHKIKAPCSMVPMRSPDGGQADHAIPGTPQPRKIYNKQTETIRNTTLRSSDASLRNTSPQSLPASGR